MVVLNLFGGAIWPCMLYGKKMLHNPDGGSIINIDSINGTHPLQGRSAYAAAKAGIDNFTMSLAREINPKLRVNSIAPGFFPNFRPEPMLYNEDGSPSLRTRNALQHIAHGHRRAYVAVETCWTKRITRGGTATRLYCVKPGGDQDPESPIVQAAVLATEAVGVEPVLFPPSSTNANFPIALGIPSLCICAGGEGGSLHALNEWYDPTGSYAGAQKALLLVFALAGLKGVTAPVAPIRE